MQKSASLISNNNRYPGAAILKKYKEKYNFLKDKNILENSAFKDDPPNDSRHNMDMNKISNKNSKYYNEAQIIILKNQKINESLPKMKLVEFNNIRMKDYKPLFDYRNINNDYNIYNNYYN